MKSKNPYILIAGLVLILFLAGLLDRWQAFMGGKFQETFDPALITVRLWSIPLGTLLIFTAGLILIRSQLADGNRAVSISSLVLGGAVLFLPSLAISLGLVVELARIGIDIDYFGDDLIFYTAGLLAAAGLAGLCCPVRKAPEKEPR